MLIKYDENDFEHSVAESMSELVRFGDETKGVTETPVLSLQNSNQTI